jgi:hypothetical protein
MSDVQSDSFKEIYAAVAAAVESGAAERGASRPFLRDPSVADVSVLGVPRATLLGIEDDRAFVANCYLVLLDRAPVAKEVARRVELLVRGETTRAAMIEDIIALPEFERLRRRVAFR